MCVNIMEQRKSPINELYGKEESLRDRLLHQYGINFHICCLIKEYNFLSVERLFKF